MPKYIIKRLLLIIPIILGVIFALFVILYFIHGSTLMWMPIYRGGDFLDTVFERIGAAPGFFTRYIRYCYDVFVNGDFGRSGATMQRMAREFSYRINNTLGLLASGVSVTIIVGIPIGVLAAIRRDKLTDRLINIISLIFSSIPNYALAVALTLFLVLYLDLLPLLPIYTEPIAYVLPALVISLGGISSVARMTRTSMLEILDQPYITALRAKGLKESEVVWIHALKNAIVPTISVLGGLVSQLLCGTFVVEFFFNVPGLGSLMLNSVTGRDHYAILGCAVILTIVLSVTNTAADIIYAFINPQIKLQYAKSRRGALGKAAAK